MSAFDQPRYSGDVQILRHELDPLKSRLKHLVADLFRLDIAEPDNIADDAPLIGNGLGLDSLDALELAICLEEEFGLTIDNREESHRAFATISSLACYIEARLTAARTEGQSQASVRITGQVLSSS